MLRQHKYILDILTWVDMTSCKLVDTLVSTSNVEILPDALFSDHTRFHQIMGAFQYLTFTRLDIGLLLTESVSLCMLPHILIRPSLNVLCFILKVWHSMTSISLVILVLLYMILRMQIRQIVLMTRNLQVVTLFSLVRCRFHRSQASNAQLFAPLLKMSIKP